MDNPAHGEAAWIGYGMATAEVGERTLHESPRLAEVEDIGADGSVRRDLEWRRASSSGASER
jgi:hypothetical protein